VWFTMDCEGRMRSNVVCAACSQSGSSAVGCHLDSLNHLTMMASLGSRSSVLADIDNDGDLDIVTNEFNGFPQILISDLASKRAVHFVEVRLRGTRSNRDGLGAQVTVVLPDGRKILKVMDGKSGYLSQSDLPLYFGLGADARAASIEVLWPDGRVQIVAGAAGTAIEIVEH
jgi:enediyne biosynthesis protein E4